MSTEFLKLAYANAGTNVIVGFVGAIIILTGRM
jgi:preprotein translocase subunit Sss1